MKELTGKLRRRKAAFVVVLLLAFFSSGGMNAARAQDEDDPGETPEVRRELQARRRGANTAGLLRILNLTPGQRAQIGAIRRETEPQGRLLGARLRDARRALDEAIYAASVDESVVEERLRELSEAQAAVVRLRSFTELRIRRVLTPEQLDIFRRIQLEASMRRRANRTAGRQGDAPAGAPARLRDRERRRAEEQLQQQRSPVEQNAPPPAPSERRPAQSRERKP